MMKWEKLLSMKSQACHETDDRVITFTLHRSVYLHKACFETRQETGFFEVALEGLFDFLVLVDTLL